jgi:hypothetical protein
MYISGRLVVSLWDYRVCRACFRASTAAVVSASAISIQGPMFQLYTELIAPSVLVFTTKAAVFSLSLEPSV